MNHIRGRFQKPADEHVVAYSASLPIDRRLYQYDIIGSIAHARMLARQGIISSAEGEQIEKGLEQILDEIRLGFFQFKNEYEDIHMAVEVRLIELTGDVGRKLHTGRSRNDQVATDTRLYVMHTISEIIDGLGVLQEALVNAAEANRRVVMPGYTHLQVAQPVLFAHHMLAYFEMLKRDVERFLGCYDSADIMPLGSGALAGVPYPIDRNSVAKELGFSQISRNSIDAVSDRDFIIEFEAAASICMMHISRLAEELILWSSGEFGFIEIDDAYAHGSSIMPQKKNPDVAELARGKTGRVYGDLMGMLTVMKGLPLAYNSDMQEDKERLFDAADTLLDTLEIISGMISNMTVNPDRMKEALERSYVLATDFADYLVKKGESFRNAHDIVGRLVQYAVGKGKRFNELTMEEFQSFSPLFGEDIKMITIDKSLKARNVPGGTAPRRVADELKRARKHLEIYHE